MIASGGIGDGRGLVAALALGAEGVNMGTRFMATKEAPIHDNVKQALVEQRRARDLADLPHHAQHQPRLGNSMAKKAIEMEHEGKTIEDIRHLVAGARGKVVYETGDLDDGIWSAGMVQGLIHDVPTCKELIDRIISEAEEIIRGRLAKAIAA